MYLGWSLIRPWSSPQDRGLTLRRYAQVLGLSCLTALTGCAANETRKSDKENFYTAVEEVAAIALPSSSDSNDELNRAFSQVNAKCAGVLIALDRRAAGRRRTFITVAIIGALAGSVVAPAIIAGNGSKAASSIFSGLAGVGNTTQQLFGEQGYTRGEITLVGGTILGYIQAINLSWANAEVGLKGNEKRQVKAGLLRVLQQGCSTGALTSGTAPVSPVTATTEETPSPDGEDEDADTRPE